uniref:Alcohol dehydrogenase-like C-terminal domain-containing protein n=1 Tax=Chaetoceros debilis TaxID=122233 RepID=A0A7S3PVZ1_9STRA|mmetsp:Transcript_6131/g.9009  ORF Transcript_6131/g.9009 Transcript_6131/m.9009 type:complete len:197 (+) Transcript_6131:1514-2104(+)
MKGIYVAGVSCEPERLVKEPILCNCALNYKEKDIYDFSEWKNVGLNEKFDTIVDLAGGGWLRLLEQSKTVAGRKLQVVKPSREGGRYLTLTPDTAHFELNSIWGALKLFLFVPLFRAMSSRFSKRANLPAFTYATLDNDAKIMNETLKLASEKKLKAVIDNRGPFEFTTDGVQKAFKVKDSRHVHGKVVISIPKSK